MFSSILLLCCFTALVYSNWSQLGHDERNTFRSDYVPKSSDSWEVEIEAYAPSSGSEGENSFMMDDNTGVIWLISQWDWSYGWNQVTAIDSETGKILFTTKIDCAAECGLPVLTETTGDMIFYADEGDAIETIDAKSGELGWIFNFSAGWNTAITSDDILIVYTDIISAIKYESPNKQILWNLNITSEREYNLGYFTTSGKNDNYRVYFTEQTEPIHFWIIDSETGEVVNKKYYPVRSSEIFYTKFTVDSKNSVVYFMDNWSGDEDDDDLNGPFLLAMEDPSLKSLWNTSLYGGEQTVCSTPILARPSSSSLLLTFCSTWNGQGYDQTLYVISTKDGSILRSQKFVGEDGCSTLTLMGEKEDKVVIQCIGDFSPTPKIISYDLLTGDLKTLIKNEPFAYSPIADSGNCIYYCTGKYASKPVTVKKQCF